MIEGEDGRQALELGAVAGGVGLDAVDLLDPDETEVSLAVLGRADLADDVVAGAQSEPADLGLRDVDVAGGGVGAVLPQESVAVVDYGENAAGVDGASALLCDDLGDAGD